MQEPAIFRIVDGAGAVHHANLTSSQADAFMGLMLAGGQFSGLRSERMDATPQTRAAPMPAVAAAFAAEQAVSKAIANIEPGTEREVLREAIEAHRNASDCLARAGQAVEHAKAFVDARQLEVDVLTAARDNEIKVSARFLAEALKDNDTETITTHGRIDSSAIANAENLRTAARGALNDLTAELGTADAAFKSAESAVRLAIMAVKRADVATYWMTGRAWSHKLALQLPLGCTLKEGPGSLVLLAQKPWNPLWERLWRPAWFRQSSFLCPREVLPMVIRQPSLPISSMPLLRHGKTVRWVSNRNTSSPNAKYSLADSCASALSRSSMRQPAIRKTVLAMLWPRYWKPSLHKNCGRM